MISIAKRHFDGWAQKVMRVYDRDFKISHITFIANVDPAGSTNNEIAKNALIAKQSMSKIINELESKGMILSEKSPVDGRRTKIMLAEPGTALLNRAYQEVADLTDIYKKLVGADRFDTAVEVLHEIVKYHETLETAPQTEKEA